MCDGKCLKNQNKIGKYLDWPYQEHICTLQCHQLEAFYRQSRLYPSHIESSDLKSSSTSWYTDSLSPMKKSGGLAMWFVRLDSALNGRDAIGCDDGPATGWVAGCSGPAGLSFTAVAEGHWWCPSAFFISHTLSRACHWGSSPHFKVLDLVFEVMDGLFRLLMSTLIDGFGDPWPGHVHSLTDLLIGQGHAVGTGCIH